MRILPKEIIADLPCSNIKLESDKNSKSRFNGYDIKIIDENITAMVQREIALLDERIMDNHIAIMELKEKSFPIIKDKP